MEWPIYKPRNTKDWWPLPEARIRQGRIPRRVSEGAQLCWHLDFKLLAIRTLREKNILLFETTWLVVIYYGRSRKLTHLLNLFFWILYIFWIFTNISSHSVSLISNILVLRILGSRILAPMWNIEFIMSLPSVWSGRKDEYT